MAEKDNIEQTTAVQEMDDAQEKHYDHNGNIEHDEEYEHSMFSDIDRMRKERFVKEQQKEKDKFLFTINSVLTDKEISMHQVVYDEVGECGMVKLSVRDLINKASDYKEKREEVSRIVMKAIYCRKDAVLELRAYCRREDIARWLTM